MLNQSSNLQESLELGGNPFNGVEAQRLLRFFQDEEKYNTVMELFFCVEQALYVPNPLNYTYNLEQEYWLLMQFLNDQALAGEFVRYRAAQMKEA